MFLKKFTNELVFDLEILRLLSIFKKEFIADVFSF